MTKKLLFLLFVFYGSGACTFSEFASKFKGVGFLLILLSIVLVVLFRRRNPDRKFKIGSRKKNLKF